MVINRGNIINGVSCAFRIAEHLTSNKYTADVQMSGELGSINSQVKVLIQLFDKNVPSERLKAEALMKSNDFIEKIEEKGNLFLVMKLDESMLDSMKVDEFDKTDDERTVFKQEYDDGFIHFDNGRYMGELKDGLPHGKGKMLWNDHTVYDGDWVNGYMQGNGTMTCPSRKQYVGEWRNNVRVFLTGDTSQVDNRFLNASNNGLNWVLRMFKDQKNYAHITLKGPKSRGPIADLVIKTGL